MQRIIAAVILLLCSACVTTSEEPTGYPYRMSANLDQHKVQRVVVASVNYGTPSRKLLRRHEPEVREQVAAFLNAHGLSVAPSTQFNSAWKLATEELGEPYDPATGRLNQNLRTRALAQAGKILHQQGIDLIVFADLTQLPVLVSGSGKHVARWHGATRTVELIGSGQASRTKFDWSEAFDAASLAISLVDPAGQELFHSEGGVGLLEGVNLRDVKKEHPTKLLQNHQDLQEAIELAFHPFIPMNNYPGVQRQ